MNNTLNIALTLANCSMKVFPLSSGSKVPVQGSHGEYDATNDPNIIKKCFNDNPNYNLAINLQTSSLAVIDLDKHNQGPDGVVNYRNYLLNHGNNQVDSVKTYTEVTPRGGLHIFYKLNHNLGSKDIQLMPGAELLTGKAVVAPSLITKLNKGYHTAWAGFQSLTYDNTQSLPGWVIDLVRKAQ